MAGREFQPRCIGSEAYLEESQIVEEVQFFGLQKNEISSSEYVTNLSDYIGQSARLNGLKKIREVGGLTPDIIVINDVAFRCWKQNNRMSEDLEEALGAIYDHFKSKNPCQDVYIGRAYTVPNVEEPDGPRTAGIKSSQDFIKAVNLFYKYVVENNYDLPGAEITLAPHPFMDVTNPPLNENPFVPYQGGLALLRNDGLIFIQATFGADEAVQSKPHDEYSVQYEKDGSLKIKGDIVKKTTTIVPGIGDYDSIPLPKDVQGEQALSFEQIMHISTILRQLWSRYHEAYRVEFIAQPQGIVFRECQPYSEFVNRNDLNVEGEILVVDKPYDLEKINNNRRLIYIPGKDFARRNTKLVSDLAAKGKKEGIELIILTHGNQVATSHRMRRVRDLGHRVYFVGENNIRPKEKVRVIVENGKFSWERINPTIPFNRLGGLDTDRIGGKAWYLYQLEKAIKEKGITEIDEFSIKITKGLTLEVSAFRQYLRNLGVKEQMQKLGKTTSLKERSKILSTIRKSILEGQLPKDLMEEIKRQLTNFQPEINSVESNKFIVRSSANKEDAKGVAFAGSFDSVPTTLKKLENAIKKVYASIYNITNDSYAQAVSIDIRDIEMCVFIAPFVEVAKGGTIFTNGHGELIIEAADSAKKVVEHDKDVESIRVNTKTGQLNNTFDELRFLSQAEVEALIKLGSLIEDIWSGNPQDIEWGITPAKELVILQDRPN